MYIYAHISFSLSFFLSLFFSRKCIGLPDKRETLK